MSEREYLAALTEEALVEQLDWVRMRQKDYWHRGQYALSRWWGSLGHDLIVELDHRAYLAAARREATRQAMLPGMENVISIAPEKRLGL